MADPALVSGSDAEVWAAFREAFHELERHIKVFTSLPHASLDRIRERDREAVRCLEHEQLACGLHPADPAAQRGGQPVEPVEVARARKRVDEATLAVPHLYEPELRDDAWDPLAWVYLLGDGIFPLLAREFAPLADRLTSVAARVAISILRETTAGQLGSVTCGSGTS